MLPKVHVGSDAGSGIVHHLHIPRKSIQGQENASRSGMTREHRALNDEKPSGKDKKELMMSSGSREKSKK